MDTNTDTDTDSQHIRIRGGTRDVGSISNLGHDISRAFFPKDNGGIFQS